MPQINDYLSFPNAPVWDDMMATTQAPLASGGGTPASINFSPSGSIRVLEFSLNDSINGSVQFSHAYKEGSNIEPHVHWAPVNTNTGNVLWSLDYFWLNISQAPVGAPTNIQIQQAASGLAWGSQYAEFPVVVGTGKTVSSLFMFRLIRIAPTVPAYNADPVILAFDIHYQMDALGSRKDDMK